MKKFRVKILYIQLVIWFNWGKRYSNEDTFSSFTSLLRTRKLNCKTEIFFLDSAYWNLRLNLQGCFSNPQTATHNHTSWAHLMKIFQAFLKSNFVLIQIFWVQPVHWFNRKYNVLTTDWQYEYKLRSSELFHNNL